MQHSSIDPKFCMFGLRGEVLYFMVRLHSLLIRIGLMPRCTKGHPWSSRSTLNRTISATRTRKTLTPCIWKKHLQLSKRTPCLWKPKLWKHRVDQSIIKCRIASQHQREDHSAIWATSDCSILLPNHRVILNIYKPHSIWYMHIYSIYNKNGIPISSMNISTYI